MYQALELLRLAVHYKCENFKERKIIKNFEFINKKYTS